MNPQCLVIEQEEFSLSFSKQPTMPTLDSKRYQEWIRDSDTPCPVPRVPTAPDLFLLPLLKIEHMNISNHFQQWHQQRALPEGRTASCLLWL